MEVPGRLGGRGSALVCIPCDRDSLNAQAYGFCLDCHEHLCQTCYNHHKRARPLQNHILLDRNSMPKIQSMASAASDDTQEFCQNHKDKVLEFYCENHKSVACYVCVALEHKQCQIDYISDVSGNVPDEMNGMLERIDTLLKKCKSSIENADQTVQDMDQSHEKAVKDIKQFRKEINECLDQMEANIIKEADALVKKLKCKHETVKATCLEIREEIERSKSLLKQLREENKHYKLFIEMKYVEKRLQMLAEKEKEALNVNKSDETQIKFTRNTNLLDIFKTENAYGRLSTYVGPITDRAVEIWYTDTINVKSQLDKKECNITGIVMIEPSTMIVTDLNNQSIKMIDIAVGSVVTEKVMTSSPIDIISLPERNLAVTLTNEKYIQIMSHDVTGFSLRHRILIRETCNGIAYCQNKFVVCCFASRKIIIVNVNGVFLNVLNFPAVFNGPVRAVISKDKKFLYISDTDGNHKNKVIKLDWEGNVKEVFEEQGYSVPVGMLQFKDDMLLVCYRDSDTIARLSSSLRRYDIVGIEEAGLYTPKALAYSSRDQKLYVCCSSKKGMWSTDIVKVFNIK